ncbi:hypothetical protein LTS10_005255 [Elasticomyces elasticus]|nr:hypothetical protein LTS10_005255 [Elasticomyces elasticus]
MRIIQTPGLHRRDQQRFFYLWTPDHSLAIKRLLERPYWSRLWVFQEITLARHKVVMCGRSELAWDSFAYFLDVVASVWMSNSKSLLSPMRRPIFVARASRRAKYREAREWLRAVQDCPAMPVVKFASQDTQASPLWDLMFALEHLGCADPRDKVYALLGVAAQTRAAIEPDYTVSVETLAHAVLKHQHGLKPPQDTDEVAKQCRDLEGLLGLHEGEMLVMVGQHQRLSNAAFKTSKVLRLGATYGTGLDWAFFHGHDAVKDLLTRDIVEENTPQYLEWMLENAVTEGNEPLVEMLLALKVIRTNHHLHMRVRWHDHGPPTSFLDTAVRYGHVGVAHRLLETGHYDVNAHLPRVLHRGRGVCSLHLAAQQCDVAMIKMLMAVQGINAHHQCGGKTFLEDAARPANVRCKPREDINTLKALLAPGNGASPAGGVAIS